MKQSLQLKIGQSLTMTPQLQQAIKLLQLGRLEYIEALEKELLTYVRSPSLPFSKVPIDPLAPEALEPRGMERDEAFASEVLHGREAG